MATKPLEVKLLQASHWVELEPYSPHGIRKEQVYARLASNWRGQDVQIEAVLDRYQHSNGLSDWRLYSVDVRAWDQARGGFYDYVSDVARQRLREACAPVALAYTTSDDYAITWHAALVRAIRDAVREERYDSVALTRRMVEAWSRDLGRETCETFEHLAKQLEGVRQAMGELTTEKQIMVYVPSSRVEKVTA